MTTVQNAQVDLRGRTTLKLVLQLGADTIEALQERGMDAPPKQVVLHLRESTERERRKFFETKDELVAADPVAFMANLLKRRCPDDLPMMVFEEMVLDMGETTIAQLQEAYLSGRLVDPKVMRAAVEVVRNQLANATINAISEGPLPFSQDGMESDPGSETS